MKLPTKVSVVGLGRLGAPVAACMAARGFEVVGTDRDPRKVGALNERRALTYEPGFQELLTQVAGNLRATPDLEEAVASTDLTFVIVPTPSGADGAFSLEYVVPTCQRIGEALRDKSTYHLVVLTSNVMPGSTGRQVRKALEEGSGKKVGAELGLCYSAVFVTMGNVIRDFLAPTMAIIGESDSVAGDLLESFFKQACENDPPVARMGFQSAELTKLALNVFAATKISFANMLARVCELVPGANVDHVTSAMQMDPRVGRGAMCGAIAYGGPFFFRDNDALAALLKRLTVAPELTDVLGRFNRAQVPWLADRVYERVEHGDRVGILGLSYKPDTDVIIESAGIGLCERLRQRHLDVVAHDPAAMPIARNVLPSEIQLAESAAACIGACDLVVITTPWRDYREVPGEVWSRAVRPRTVLDCWRLRADLWDREGVEYVPLGIGPGAPPDDGGVRLDPTDSTTGAC